MKHVPGIILLAFVAALNSYGQGSVTFANGSQSRVFMLTGTGTTTFVPAGSQFTAELMYAPDGASSESAFEAAAVRIGATTAFGPIAGLFSGGGRTVNGITPAGGFGMFQVRVWETAAGNSYRDVAGGGSGLIGKSGILRVDTGDPTFNPFPQTPARLTDFGLTSFCIGPSGDGGCIPEPSTLTLGLLGLIAFTAYTARSRK